MRLDCLFQFRLVGYAQFMTTLCTAAGQYFTAVGGLHPLAEAMNRLAATSVWLKCTLHLKNFYTLPKFNQDYGSPYPSPVKGMAKLGKFRKKPFYIPAKMRKSFLFELIFPHLPDRRTAARPANTPYCP